MLTALRDMLKRNEGVRHRVYKDSLGIPTVGVGFNLMRPDARVRCQLHGIDYDALLAGKITLTDAQVDAFLDEDVVACRKSLVALIPEVIQMPREAQNVLLDMRFQLGEGGLRAFKNTLRAFSTHDWKAAAAGLRSSLAYKQTPLRWERNAKALEAL